MAGNGGGRGHRRAGEMGAPARSLAADEVAVRRRDAALSRRDGVAVDREAHRAAGLAPFEARLLEDAVDTLGLGLALDVLRARHDPGADMARNLAALRYLGGSAQVGDAA